MQPRILFISSWFPNKLEPTNGNFVQRHAEAVSMLQRVEVLHAVGDNNQKERYVFDEKIIHGIRTLIVYYRNSKNPVQNFLRRMSAYKKGFSKLTKPDLVHANVMHNNMLFAVWLKKKYKIPFVITEHWTALQLDNLKKTPKPILKLAKYIGNQAEYVMPVSENLLQSLKRLGINTPMSVISNVVDTQLFDIKAKTQAVAGKTVFLHVSNLIPRKNPDKIIRVASRLHRDGHQFVLNIGGDGDLAAIKQLIDQDQAASYIKTFGTLTYKEVAEEMQKSDCFILFSDNETQGCVILESLACGKPVIATKVGGVPEFVNSEYGILINARDENALYEAMKNVIQNKVTLKPASVLREFVLEKFSKGAIASQFDEVYTKILLK